METDITYFCSREAQKPHTITAVSRNGPSTSKDMGKDTEALLVRVQPLQVVIFHLLSKKHPKYTHPHSECNIGHVTSATNNHCQTRMQSTVVSITEHLHMVDCIFK
jgi:hypothetical protein